MGSLTGAVALILGHCIGNNIAEPPQTKEIKILSYMLEHPPWMQRDVFPDLFGNVKLCC